MIQIIPAILEEDPQIARERVQIAQSVEAPVIHIDISDGIATPTLTAQLSEIASGLGATPVEVHLMVEHPEYYLSECSSLNVQRILVHIDQFGSAEAFESFMHQAERYVDEVACVVDLATDVSVLKDLPLLTVQCMGVVPGEAGQEFDVRALEQLKAVHAVLPDVTLAVDGGVSAETLQDAVLAGAQRLVVNSALYRSVDPVTQYHYLMSLTRGYEQDSHRH